MVFLVLIVIKIINIKSHEAKTIKSEKLLVDLFSTGNQVIIGSDEADKTLVVFYDYNCTYCRSFFTNIYPSLYQEFVMTNELNVILKPVNLSGDETITNAYRLLPCLYKLGLFEDLHQMLIDNPNVVYTSSFATFLNTIRSENPEIDNCMIAGYSDLTSDNNKVQLAKLGQKKTPTFVIENKVYSGKFDLQIIRDILHKK